MNPKFFTEDFDFIREAGKATSDDLFKAELNFFHGRNQRDKNWIRTFAIRASAKRLMKLKN